MSTVEIFGFRHNGEAESYGEVKNSWRGAPRVWGLLEEKYLPPFKVDEDMAAMYRRLGTTPTRVNSFPAEPNLKEIWGLVRNEKVSENDKIVLCTTFDKVVVLKKDIPKVVAAFRTFEGETNLPEQADILDKIYNDHEMMAVAWNQTSINGDTWSSYRYDEETEEDIAYNLYKDREHFFLSENEITFERMILDKLNEMLIEEGFIGAKTANYELPIGENKVAVIEVKIDLSQIDFSWRLVVKENGVIHESDWLDLNEDSYVELAGEDILKLI